MNVGIAGTGRMGAAIATRLAGLGHNLAVWNRTPAKIAPLVAAGARAADSPTALATASEVIITILTNAAAIDATYGGPKGLLAGDVKGKLFIEMSTVRPEIEQALAEKVRAKGAAIVDCPVGGTTGPAREGKLFGFVGGADADVARARVLLEQMCRRIEHMGPAGAGARMKLAINLPLLVYWQAFGEALSLVQPLGVDAQRLMDIFADTSGGPNVLKARGSVVAAALEGRDTGPVGFDIESVRKDLQTMVAEAKAMGLSVPVTARALECFEQAAAAGLGEKDGTTWPALWAKHGRPRVKPAKKRVRSRPRARPRRRGARARGSARKPPARTAPRTSARGGPRRPSRRKTGPAR